MKKRFTALLVGICTMALLAGCAKTEISNDTITITKYKAWEVEKVEAVKVTDEDVELSIKSDMQTMWQSIGIKDRAAQDGETVIIDYVGKLDGEEFDGGSADDSALELGSNSFIDGFEEGIVGRMPGETFDLNLTFPDPYANNPDLAGKAVVFTVTLDAILPELTEDIVPILSSTATTVEEYKAQIRKDMETSNEESAKSELEAAVWQALVDSCVVAEYPEDLVEAYTTSITEQFNYYASAYGMEVEDLVESMYGVTMDEMVKDMVCQQLAIELIAEEEEMTITAADYEEGLKEFATQYGYDDTAEFEEAYGEDNIKQVLLQNRVAEFLMENCKQVEAEE